MTDSMRTAWNRGLEQLRVSGVTVTCAEVLETARAEFEVIAAPIQAQPRFGSEAPKLVATLVADAVERYVRHLPGGEGWS